MRASGDELSAVTAVGAVRDGASAARSAPVLPAVTGLISGIVLDCHFAVPPTWSWLFLVCGGLQMFLGRRATVPRRLGLLLAGVGCGLALHEAAFRRVERDHLVTVCGDAPVRARFRGVALTPPRVTKPPSGSLPWQTEQHSTHILLQCESVLAGRSWRSMSGLLPIRVAGILAGVMPGDRVEIFGQLSRIRAPANPGQKDWQLYNRRLGIYGQVRCAHVEAVRLLKSGARAGWHQHLRNYVTRLLLPEMRPLVEDDSSLAESIVLGQRGQVGSSLNQAFARTGTSHYLSASGLHVGMLSGFVWFIAAMLGLSRRRRAGVVMIFVLVYALVAEPRAPILRATTMAVLFCLAVIAYRAVHTLNWIAISALVILVFRPCELFNAGFQLSFLVVLGIIYLTQHVVAQLRRLWPIPPDPYARLEVRLDSPSRTKRVFVALGSGLLWSLGVALAAWCVSLPLVAIHFGRIAPWGWLNSLLLMPLAFGVMIYGLVRVLVGLVWPLAGVWLGSGLDALTSALADSARWLASWPGASVAVPPPPVWMTLALAGAMFMLISVSRKRGAERFERTRIWRLNVSAFVGLMLLTLLWPMPRRPDGLEIDVLAVGHGSATVIRLPDGRTLLYDAGTLNPFDAGGSVIVPALLSHGVDRLAGVVVSHLNADHYNAVPAVLSEIGACKVFLSDRSRPTKANLSRAGRLFRAVREGEIPVQVLHCGQVLDLGAGVQCEMLWPPNEDAGGKLATNDESLVLRFECGGRSILLCGDVEEHPQQVLLDHPRLRSDVLVLPHHGAVVANTARFIQAVSPSVIIRSSGHDAAHTYSALPALVSGSTYFNTANDGAIRVRLGGGDVFAEPFIPAVGAARSIR